MYRLRVWFQNTRIAGLGCFDAESETTCTSGPNSARIAESLAVSAARAAARSLRNCASSVREARYANRLPAANTRDAAAAHQAGCTPRDATARWLRARCSSRARIDR